MAVGISLVALTLGVVSVVGAACGGGAAPSASHSPAAMVDAHGGSATLAVDAVPANLNDHTPAGDNAATRAVDSLIWVQVFQPGPRLVPTLDTAVVTSAEVVSVSPQIVVYQINPKAVWSDGTPVSAQDFVYAWLAQRGTGQDVDGAPDAVIDTAGYRNIGSVVGSNGGSTVTVTFTSPYADWESLFDDLLPSHVAERAGWNSGFTTDDATTLVSAGPWVVTSWVPGVQIVLGRNPKWWGTPPVLDQVVVKVVPGAAAAASALRSGTAQVVSEAEVTPAVEAGISSLPNADDTVNLGTTMLQLVFQTHHAPLTSPSVRLGIAHFVDRAAIATQIVQPVLPSAWEDNNFLFANVQPWYSDDATGFEQVDPTAGQDDLADGGLVADTTGTWTAHGTPVVLHLVWASDDWWSSQVGPVVAAELVNAGFEVVTSTVPEQTLLSTTLPGGAFDLALAPVAATPFPSHTAAVYDPATPLGSGLDWSGYDDPKVDALLSQAAGQLAAQDAQAVYEQVDGDLWNAMPAVPLFAEPVLVAWSTSISGVRDDPGGLGPLWSLDMWTDRVPATTVTGRSGR